LQISETEWVVLFGADRYPTKEACGQAIEQMEEELAYLKHIGILVPQRKKKKSVDFAEQLRVLQSAQGDTAKLAMATVDLGVGILGLMTVLAARGQVCYTITDLGTLGGSFSIGTNINARGQVVGISSLTGDSSEHAFFTVLVTCRILAPSRVTVRLIPLTTTGTSSAFPT
jgi:hypothetical protein